MERHQNFRYLVLNTGVVKQRQIATVLADNFPPDRGRIFLPERESWIRKTKEIGRKPLFPGYLIAMTDMTQAELHLFARKYQIDLQTFVKELAVKESVLNRETILGDSELGTELTAEETEFLDRFLDDEGVERMSVGYREGGRYIVMEGPLQGWEKHIADSDRHNREAYLDVTFRHKRIVVGLEIKPKGVFFPDGRQMAGVLEDGTEVDLEELSRIMMGSGMKDKEFGTPRNSGVSY